MRRYLSVVFTLFLCFAVGSQCLAQDADLTDEITIGLAQEGFILSSYAKIERTQANAFAMMVSHDLLATSSVSFRPALPYEVMLIDSGAFYLDLKKTL